MLLSSYAMNASLIIFSIIQGAEPLTDTFNEMGRTMVVGVLLAIVGAVAIAIIKLKLQNKRDASSSLASISPSNHDDPN